MLDPDDWLLQAARRLQNPRLQLIYGALPAMNRSLRQGLCQVQQGLPADLATRRHKASPEQLWTSLMQS